MSWSAFDNLEPAFTATKRLLLPFALREWLTIAIVVFFVSGTSSLSPNLNIGGLDVDVAPPAPPEMWPIIDEIPIEAAQIVSSPSVVLFLLIGGFILLLGLILLYIGAVMEFVFVHIASAEEIRIRGFFGDSSGKGLSLFLFRIGIGLLIISLFATMAILTILTGGVFLLFVVLISPLLVIIAIALWLILRFTTDFVVPVMIVTDAGILQGWQEFWPELRAEWKQYGMYALVRVVLGIAVGILAGIGTVALLLILAIPFGIAGIIGYFVLSVLSEAIALVFAVGVFVLFLLALVLLAITFIQMPLQTYLRYYALLVLGSISPDYDLVADIRTSIVESEQTTEDTT